MVKIAYPNGYAPVLQDDTDNPWAEKNDISGALTLGYLLFGDAEMGYFAKNSVDANMYWFLNDVQLAMLNIIKSKQPEINSVSFPTTGYYIFREGWNAGDKMMVVTAGLDKEKPDHQHGDMLGIQAMAFEKVILPNYQVRYSLSDYEFFKNSTVKNVALVDDELQGKKYKGNQGGSGFGKFGKLPKPTTIMWKTGDEIEYFVGSHNGFNNIGVDYSRQLISVANEFWIVKDNFASENTHLYKQVWQGHYSLENSPNLLRATFDDATGNDIFQLIPVDEVKSSGARGKQWSVVSKNNATNFSFITVIYPYKGFENRIDETLKSKVFNGWKLNDSNWTFEGDNVVSLSKEDKLFVFSVNKITYGDFKIETSNKADFYIINKGNKLIVQLIGDKDIQLQLSGFKECFVNAQKMTPKINLNVGDEVVIYLN